jgi:hypothetical protein
MGENNRNKPCWCGSGKKYKKCHLNREEEQSLARKDLESHSKHLKSKKTCSVSNIYPSACSTKIVSAHTISKSGSLKEISENGHIMGTKPSLSGLIKDNGKLSLEKVGIKQASTFTGFCSVHDKEIFAPLEDEPITLSDKQLFLLAYRGMCRELFLKEQNKDTANLLRQADKGQDVITQCIVQSYASSYDKGVDLALRDLKKIKIAMDSILNNSDFSKLSHCIFEFDSVPKILVSAMITPEVDFHGNQLQKLGLQEESYDYIFFNCISYDGRGCFVFSWLTDSDRFCSKLVNSLLTYTDEKISDALVRFCYSFSENTWASPSWWDSLSESAKDSIAERLMHGTPMMVHHIDYLKDDGHKFNAFKIHKRELRISQQT